MCKHPVILLTIPILIKWTVYFFVSIGILRQVKFPVLRHYSYKLFYLGLIFYNIKTVYVYFALHFVIHSKHHMKQRGLSRTVFSLYTYNVAL